MDAMNGMDRELSRGTAGGLRGGVQRAKQQATLSRAIESQQASNASISIRDISWHAYSELLDLILWCEENAIANSVLLLVDLLFLQEQI